MSLLRKLLVDPTSMGGARPIKIILVHKGIIRVSPTAKIKMVHEGAAP